MKKRTNLILIVNGLLISLLISLLIISNSFAIDSEQVAKLSAERRAAAELNYPEATKYPSKNQTPVVNDVNTVPIPFFDNFELGNFWGWTTNGSQTSPGGQHVFWKILHPVQDPIINPQVETCVIPGLPACLLLFPDDSCLLPPGPTFDQYGVPQNIPNLKYFAYGDTLTYTFVGKNWALNPSNQCGGLPGAHSYGGPNNGSLISPQFAFIGEINGRLRFDTYWEIEGVDVHYFDRMYVQVSTSGVSGPWMPAFNIQGKPTALQGTINPVNDVNSPGGTPYSNQGVGQKPKWVNDLVDLRPFVSSNGIPLNNNLNVRFFFDTVDALYNGFRGWHIDNVEVTNKSLAPPSISQIIPSAGLPNNIVTIKGYNFAMGSIVVFKNNQTGTEYPATAGAGTGQGGQSAVLGSQIAQAVVPQLGPYGLYQVIVRYGSGTSYQIDANSVNATPVPLYFEHTNVPPAQITYVTSAYNSLANPDTADVSPLLYPQTPFAPPLQGKPQFIPHGDSVHVEIHGNNFVAGTAGNEFIARPWILLPPPVGGTSDGYEYFTPITFISTQQVDATFNGNLSPCHIPGAYKIFVKNPGAPETFYPSANSGQNCLIIYNPRPQIGVLRFFTEGIKFIQATASGMSIATEITIFGKNFDNIAYCDDFAPGYNPLGGPTSLGTDRTGVYIWGIEAATGDTIETDLIIPQIVKHFPNHLTASVPNDSLVFTFPPAPIGNYNVFILNPDGKLDYEFGKIAVVGDLQIIGDVDGNQNILSNDAWSILRHVVGIAPLPNADTFTRADVDTSNSVQAQDAAWILKRIANIVTCFPATHQNCFLPKIVSNSALQLSLETSANGLEIFAKDINSMEAGEFVLTYDPSKVKIQGVETTSLTNNFSLVYNAENGTLKIALASSDEINGSGSLIKIKATGKELASVKLTGSVINAEKINSGAVPVSYSLEQNYPNPFNPTTSIKYSVPKNVKIEIKVFNTLGQTVNTLFNGTSEAGSHVVQWNGTDSKGKPVSSGVYFYQIKTENFTQTKKMLLIK
ncbi:T9SS type A sorting domain-containing protein [bacterium]|nr:T9SS type A sorting domain-containing protein [bacterium]